MFPTSYEPLFFNSNFTEAASTAGLVAYRGELILQEGEVADAQGRRKPPTEVLKQAILLGDVDGLKLISGSLDELKQFQFVLETAGADFNSGTIAVFFTVNIPKPWHISPAASVPAGSAWRELTSRHCPSGLPPIWQQWMRRSPGA